MHHDRQPLTDIGRVAALSGRQLERFALLVHPRLPVGQPEPDLERRITNRPRQRRPHLPRLHMIQLHHQIPHIPARPLNEEQAREPDHDEDDVGHEHDRVLLERPDDVGAPQVRGDSEEPRRRLDERRNHERSHGATRRRAERAQPVGEEDHADQHRGREPDDHVDAVEGGDVEGQVPGVEVRARVDEQVWEVPRDPEQVDDREIDPSESPVHTPCGVGEHPMNLDGCRQADHQESLRDEKLRVGR